MIQGAQLEGGAGLMTINIYVVGARIGDDTGKRRG